MNAEPNRRYRVNFIAPYSLLPSPVILIVFAKIPLGSTEIWELVNTSSSMMKLPHSMHLHDVQFNILDRNGKPPSQIEMGRKDTVLLWPNDRVRIIARFLDYTGIYMFHCHMLAHHQGGMGTWIRVRG